MPNALKWIILFTLFFKAELINLVTKSSWTVENLTPLYSCKIPTRFINISEPLILSDKIFTDIIGGVEVHKPIEESKYGAHQFNTELVKLEDDWLFLDNGYNESLPKAFTPRGSFSFYKKELIDMLPDNKFNMYENGGYGIVNRSGETASVGYDGIKAWNTHAGTFRDFLYESNLVESTRWLSDKKRVSKYCIEGERGFVSNHRAGENYLESIQKQLGELGWI